MREIRTLRAMWRGLETTYGSDTEALSTETESKQSRPHLRSIGANPRPYRALKRANYNDTITLEVFTDDRHYLAYSRDRLRALWNEIVI